MALSTTYDPTYTRADAIAELKKDPRWAKLSEAEKETAIANTIGYYTGRTYIAEDDPASPKYVPSSLSDDASAPVTPTTPTTTTTVTETRAPIVKQENKLHDYVNWTYNIGWYMLEIATFNEFVRSGKDTRDLRRHPIFKSGGIKENAIDTGIDFDLGLKSLRLSGVIGNNQFSPNANQYDIEMEIIEPFGISLLPKLRLLAQDVAKTGGANSEFQIPYLLDIRWMGYDDTSKIITGIPDTGPKLIAVQIVNVSMNITSTGTIYTITFAPYTQLPLSNTLGVIRTDTNLYGGTLDEILRTGEQSLKAKLNATGENDKKEGRAEKPDTYDFKIISYSGPGRSPDNKLATEPLTFAVKGGRAVSPQLLHMTEVDLVKQGWPFIAQSNVKDIVGDLARNSKYFQDKIIDPVTPESSSHDDRDAASEANANAANKNAAMELVKVLPVVTKLGEFDSIRGVYQKDILYLVFPYYLYGQVYPRAGQATVASRGVVKEYNWIFTGKNKDVFNVDLHYDLLYFRLFQTNPSAKALADTSYEVETSTKPMVQSKPGGVASTYTSLVGDINARSSKGDKPNAVQEYFEQQLNPSYGNDLVSMDLDIIGDPDWIVQDRSVRPVGDTVDAGNNGYVDGDPTKGISVDVDGVYVNVNFRTPVDYNDRTGLMDLTSESALISGFYQAITVESVFEDGKFTQKLHLVRVPSQESNKVKSAPSATTSSSAAVLAPVATALAAPVVTGASPDDA